jgi:hypothetical protein
MTSGAILSTHTNRLKTIMCTIGGLSAKLGSIGKEVVVKNTFWTEYALADEGDYLLIGVSAERTRLWPVPTRSSGYRWNDTRAVWKMTR